jgi:hypothetical protein
MSKKNISLIALSIAVLALIGAIGLVTFMAAKKNSPTPVPSDKPSINLGNQLPQEGVETVYPTEVSPDWGLYSNSKYGYNLNFPPDWATIINVTPTSSKETLDNATSLDIFDSAAKKSYPDSIATIQYLSAAPQAPSGFSQSEITLNGIKAQKFTGDSDGLHKETYFIPQNQGGIQIEIRYTLEDQIQKTFEAMLGTFQLN